MVTGLVLAADTLGPRLSGIFSSYPVILTVVGTFTHHRWGSEAVWRMLRGITVSLFSFVVFFLVVGLSLPAVGLVGVLRARFSSGAGHDDCAVHLEPRARAGLVTAWVPTRAAYGHQGGASFMNAPAPTTYTVEAYNLSHASENKIHDDTVAQKLGFSGGLVPGVEVYAYACHPAVRRWGRAWLESGRIECRFLKPVYDGRLAVVSAAESRTWPRSARGERGLSLCHWPCIAAASRRPAAATDAYEVRTPPAERPPADETSLAAGTWLGITAVAGHRRRRWHNTCATCAKPIRSMAERALLHPGQLLRLANLVLRENVVLQPWIHTGSKVTNFAAARIGDELSARGRVAANYERKGTAWSTST